MGSGEEEHSRYAVERSAHGGPVVEISLEELHGWAEIELLGPSSENPKWLPRARTAAGGEERSHGCRSDAAGAAEQDYHRSGADALNEPRNCVYSKFDMNDSHEASQSVSKRTALAVASISSFALPFMSSSINVALPSIGHVFDLNAVILGWVATIFLLAAAIFLLPFGKIADIVGRKKIYLIGIISFTIFSAVSALSPNIVFLLIARALQGAGAALIFGTGVAILTSVFPPSERGKALGTNVAFTYTGLSLGPVFGGVLTQGLGWASIFWIMVPLGVVATTLVLWKLKGEWKGAEGERVDVAGSVIAGLSLAVLIYGLSILPSIRGYAFVVVGIAGLVGFVAWERHTREPVVRMDMFVGNRVFSMSNLAALINYSATFAITFFMSLYLQYIKGLDPERAGLILIAQPAMMAIFSPITGRLSDRYQARVLASVGMGTMAVMLFLLSRIGPETSLWFLIPCLLVLGIGYALFSSPNANAIMGSVERKVYGVASAMMSIMRLMGQMMSMAIALLIVSIHVGNTKIAPGNYPALLASLRTAFTVFAVLSVAGVFASLSRGKVVHEPAHD